MQDKASKPADPAQLARDRAWLELVALKTAYGRTSGRAWQGSPLVNLANMTVINAKPTRDV